MVITGDHLVTCHEHSVRATLSLTSQWDSHGHRSDKRNGNTLSETSFTSRVVHAKLKNGYVAFETGVWFSWYRAGVFLVFLELGKGLHTHHSIYYLTLSIE